MVHIDVAVAVQVRDVQQLLEVVGGHLALLFEPGTFVGVLHNFRRLLLRGHCCRLVRHGVSLSSFSCNRVRAVRWTGIAGVVWSTGPWLSRSLPLCPSASIAARSASVGGVGPLQASCSRSPRRTLPPARSPHHRPRARSPCSSSTSPSSPSAPGTSSQPRSR